jgi:GNAT superfamily N-acetyltransferase
VNVVPADRFSLAELAALYEPAYEGYFVPVQVDEATMRFMVEWWDIDLARSRVVEGKGFAFLAVRGERAWIGGVGVVPSARRQGIARALMESVLAEAPGEVTLEVIEQNVAAKRLYDDLGFEPTRMLEVWSLPEVPEVAAQAAEPAPLGQHGLPWQRADESLPQGYERLEVEGGAILLRGGGVLQLDARDEDVAAALLSRGRALSFVNVPEGDVATGALARLGGTRTLRQYEMRRMTSSTA